MRTQMSRKHRRISDRGGGGRTHHDGRRGGHHGTTAAPSHPQWIIRLDNQSAIAIRIPHRTGRPPVSAIILIVVGIGKPQPTQHSRKVRCAPIFLSGGAFHSHACGALSAPANVKRRTSGRLSNPQPLPYARSGTEGHTAPSAPRSAEVGRYPRTSPTPGGPPWLLQ